MPKLSVKESKEVLVEKLVIDLVFEYIGKEELDSFQQAAESIINGLSEEEVVDVIDDMLVDMRNYCEGASGPVSLLDSDIIKDKITEQ